LETRRPQVNRLLITQKRASSPIGACTTEAPSEINLGKLATRWERGFAALSKFRKREGHCCPPRYHLEGKYNLGNWVTAQRYLKNKLSVERKKRLDRIGFVWNWRDFAWERGFATLVEFKLREGHCRVPIQHREGKFRLGYWISVQRRKKNVMSPKRRAKLNNINFVWYVYRRT
jgi:hypothetical protein